MDAKFYFVACSFVDDAKISKVKSTFTTNLHDNHFDALQSRFESVECNSSDSLPRTTDTQDHARRSTDSSYSTVSQIQDDTEISLWLKEHLNEI